MQLSKAQLDMLERMGSNFFSARESAIVLEVSEIDLKSLLKDENSAAHKRYYKGYFISLMELREAIIKMAKRGSSPAQKMLLDILQDMKVANV
jgi:hypothetical protein